MRQRSPAAPGSKAAVVVDQVRLFRRLPEARWGYRVHEQILPALRRTGVDLRRSDVVIQHAGHEDAGLRRRKLERDLRLLLDRERRAARRSVHPVQPGCALPRDEPAGRGTAPVAAEPGTVAAPRFDRAQAACPDRGVPSGSCNGRARPSTHAGRGGSTIPTMSSCSSSRPCSCASWAIAAGAEATLLRLARGTSPAAGFANGDDGLRGYKARHNLAVIYEETGRAAEAEAQWRAAVAENPQFTPGWLRLGELYLKQRRWDDLEAAAQGLSACPAGAEKADALRARGRQARHAETDPSTSSAVRAETSRLAVHDRQGRRGRARRLPGVGRRPRR